MFIYSLSKKEKPTKGKNVEHLPGVTIVISREGRDPEQENSRDGDHHWRASHFPQLLCQGGNCMSCANWPGQWGNGQVGIPLPHLRGHNTPNTEYPNEWKDIL